MISSVIFYLLLFLSLFINMGAVWYIVQLLREMKLYHDRFVEVNYMIRDYRNHLEAVYELDMFYGDTTLSELLRHTKDLSNDIENYTDDFPFGDLEQSQEEESFE